ncbi:MAG: TIGR03118 family protein [Bacteroidota bacterium]
MATTSKNYTGTLKLSLAALALFSLASTGCSKSSKDAHTYAQVNLVSDTSGYNANRTDTALVNPWGIAIGTNGNIWVATNHKGRSLIYDGNGNAAVNSVSQQSLGPINIPLDGVNYGASPSGIVFNTSNGFLMPGTGTPCQYIIVTEDGTISAWSAGMTAVQVLDGRSYYCKFKGAAMANDGTNDYLYMADFHEARVVVADRNFHFVNNKPFIDNSIPNGYAPFNIQNIGGLLYVTYAKQKGPDNTDDDAGIGNGYINVFKPDGTLVKRFASKGTLNSPWGIVQAPAGFSQVNNEILVGNFGDGHINVFDGNGNYISQLKTSTGTIITIPGLWALTFPTAANAGLDMNKLYFTAGPQSETHGVFGYLKVQ